MVVFHFSMIFFTLYFLTFFFCYYKNFIFSFSYLHDYFFSSDLFFLGFNLDLVSIFFSFMVFSVVSLVSVYSQFYMEHYNNFKFILVKFSFLMAMLFMCVSSSSLVFFMGWDGLGLTSIFLIMFYPNKITLYNSVMTMFYNRLGDILLISFLCFLFSISCSYVMVYFYENWFSLILLIFLCSFTKSAQFPLSSWLPAAMSAPTPISAMVHSSTLVTAGLFSIYSFYYYISFYSLVDSLVFISSLTFFLGGVMSFKEKDSKKMIAFSTLSQISLIFFIFSLGFFFLSVSHMISHAFFKSLIFCVIGTIFSLNLSNQNPSIFFYSKYFVLILFFFLVSVFFMSGLIFSSSFFTKDVALELALEFKSNFFFFMLILGSLLTLFYSTSLLSILRFNFKLVFFFYNKSYFFYFFGLYLLITLFVSKFLFKMIFLETANIFFNDQFLCLFILILPLLCFFNLNFKFYISLVFENFFMKMFSFSFFSKFFFSSVLKFDLNLINDKIFYSKPYFYFFKTLNWKEFCSYIFLIFFIFLV